MEMKFFSMVMLCIILSLFSNHNRLPKVTIWIWEDFKIELKGVSERIIVFLVLIAIISRMH